MANPLDFAPYHRFTKDEWSRFRADEPMTLGADDIERLRALSDPISFDEAEEIYLPLSRLISLYVEATQGLHHASMRFLGTTDGKMPYIIGVAGSVAVGKSTTARPRCLPMSCCGPTSSTEPIGSGASKKHSKRSRASAKWCVPPFMKFAGSFMICVLWPSMTLV